MSDAAYNNTEFTGLPPAPAARPTPEQIDEMAAKYNLADVACTQANAVFDIIEKECIDLVAAWGVTPPKAEASRRLEGKLAELTVTTGNSIAIDESRVEDLRQALIANERGDFFDKLFSVNTKHELIKGADIAMRTETMNKRLSERVLALFGRCFIPKKKNPSLKVKLLEKTPRPKKERKPKAQEAGM